MKILAQSVVGEYLQHLGEALAEFGGIKLAELGSEYFALLGGTKLAGEGACAVEKNYVAVVVVGRHPMAHSAKAHIGYLKPRFLTDLTHHGIREALARLHMAAGEAYARPARVVPALDYHIVPVADHTHIRQYAVIHSLFLLNSTMCYIIHPAPQDFNKPKGGER